MNLYDMIMEFLRIQNRQDAWHQTEMLQAIADSMGKTTQTEDVNAHGFSILPKLYMGSNSFPLDGIIHKALRATWDLNSLSPQLWTQGYRQRKAMHTTGTIFNTDETLQLIHLAAEVVQRHVGQHSIQHTHHSLEGISEESASFIRIGSSWLRELTIDNMSNWSLINQLTTEIILSVMTLRQDDPITLGNCMHILCLLSSTDEFGGKIRGLGEVGKIIKLLPRQFSEKRGVDTLQSTWTQNNKNLRLTLRTLRHITDPDISNPYYPRIGTGANLEMVLGNLLLERCHGGTRWAHGCGAQCTQVWVVDTRCGGGTPS